MLSLMKSLLIVASVLALFFFVGCAATVHESALPSLENAENAYFQLDYAASRNLFEKVAHDPATAIRDRVKAMRKLALMEWKFNRRHESALSWVALGLDTGEEVFETYSLLSRIEQEAGDIPAAREAALHAEEAAQSEAERTAAVIRFAAVTLKAAEQVTEGGDAALKKDLQSAMTRLSNVLDNEPGERSSSKLLLGIALKLECGPPALRAWRSFHLLPEGARAEGILAAPCETLEALLPGWVERPLTRSERERLVIALADSRFFKYAEWMAHEPGRKGDEPLQEDPRIKEIVAYSRFLESVRASADEYYRQTAIGNDTTDDFLSMCEELALGFWEALHFPDSRPDYAEDLFDATLRERFGTVINFSKVSGYFGLAMGHVVIDDRRTLVQYGQEADLAFVALDQMVSNFYTSWFWDGAAAVGGWARPDTIYQVSEAYASGPFEGWRSATDPVERAKLEEEIRTKSTQDDDLALDNPCAYLPGLDLRLQLAALDRILQAVDQKGYKGSARCLAFISEYKRIKLAYSIFAHEGRHSIDQRMNPERFVWWKLGFDGFDLWDQDEKEFRAKLSEIAFSPDPQMAFSHAVFNRNMGDATGHGKANLRIVEKIVEWMEEHRLEIKGLDPARPLLPQLDLLTHEQFRTAIQEMDPLYPSGFSAAS
ncbi:MAG: hypothetical protein ABIK28_23970 [Planctomycetota bacterium]